jgi:hypothetical protein
MFKATWMAAAIAVAGVAQAQAPSAPAASAAPASPAKKELVAKVLQLTQPGVEGLARNMAEQPAMQVMQQAGAALQRLPAERREALARDIESDVRKYVDETTPIVREKAFKLAPSTLGVLLEERFNEDELRQIVAMLESPVNKKFQGLFPEMQKTLIEKLVADSRAEVEPRLQAMQASVGKRLGLTPPVAASAPKATPSSAVPAKK